MDMLFPSTLSVFNLFKFFFEVKNSSIGNC